MGLSIANTMSPFMGRGAPMTVIKGGFALGLVKEVNSEYQLLFAPSIKFNGLASSSTGFSYKVTGRTGLEDYNSPQGLTEIPDPYYVQANTDYNGFVPLYYNAQYSNALSAQYSRGNTTAGRREAEEAAHSACPALGTAVASDVRIVIYGKLDSLSVESIKAGGTSGYEASPRLISTNMWSYKYEYQWAYGVYNGWYASEVHIFDNPQLRGHVSAGTAKLFWDC